MSKDEKIKAAILKIQEIRKLLNDAETILKDVELDDIYWNGPFDEARSKLESSEGILNLLEIHLSSERKSEEDKYEEYVYDDHCLAFGGDWCQ